MSNRHLRSLLFAITSGAALIACPGDEPDPGPGSNPTSAARSALEQGNCSAARAAFERESGATALFGQAFARTLCLVEHPYVDSVLDDLDFEPFRSADFFGRSGRISLHRRGTDQELNLHPLLEDSDRFAPAVAGAPDSLTVAVLFDRMDDILTEMEALSELYESAVDMDADVSLTIPGPVFGARDDIVLDAATASAAAAALAAAEAAIRIVRSYETDVRINVFCDQDQCDVSGMMGRVATDEVNMGLGGDGGPELDVARQRLERATTLGLAAIAALSETSILVRNAQTEGGLIWIRDLLAAIETSLASASTAVPEVAPEVSADIALLFSMPPDLDALSTDPFVGEFEFVESWGEELIDPYTDLDFQSSYSFNADNDLNDAVDAWSDHFEDLGGGPLPPPQNNIDPSSCAEDCSLNFESHCSGSTLVRVSRDPGCREVGVCNWTVSRRACDGLGFICSGSEGFCIEPDARGCDCSNQPSSQCLSDTRLLYFEPPASCAPEDACEWARREVDCPTGSQCFGGACEFSQ